MIDFDETWSGNDIIFRTYMQGGGMDGKSSVVRHKGIMCDDFKTASKHNSFGAEMNPDIVDISFDSKDMYNAFLDMAEENNWRCLALPSLKGGHTYWRDTKGIIKKGGKDKKLAVGLIADIHHGATYIPLRVFGVDRFPPDYDILDGEDYQEIPEELYPVNSKVEPFGMAEGGRNETLSSMTKNLVYNTEFSEEQIKKIIINTNRFILGEPLLDDELEVILRDETFESVEKVKKGLSYESFKQFVSELGMTIRYNELLNIVEYNNIPKQYQDIKDIQNVMPIQLQDDFKKYTGLKNISKQQVIDLIVLEADKNSYNPVKDYLQEIVWDGNDRFPEIFKILGIKSEFEQSLIKKWFYQTAALPFNTLENPIQPEGVLTLQGDEGIGKTRFFLLMTPVPIWFQSLDKELTTKNKDILIQMLSAWMGEIGEIDRTFKANRSDIKNFMTLTKDSIRKPYAREPVTRARVTSFCGTTNKAEFLNDDTGFRRWWVIPIHQKIVMGDFVQPNNLHQFWSQCYAAVCDNPQCFRLTEEEKKQLEERNKEVMEMLPAEDELRLRLNFDAPLELWHWVVPSALRNLHDYDVDRYTSKELGAAIRAIMCDVPEIKRKHSNKGTAYFIPPSINGTDRYRNK